MPFIYEAIRDFIIIRSNSTILARFISTEQDISQLTDAQLIAQEVTTIPRLTTTYQYTSDPVDLAKTVIFEPLNVVSSEEASFNTVILTAGPDVIARYQLDTTINIAPGIPSIVTLGALTLDFNDRVITDE